MTPTIYCGDHQHARVVCSAFAEGCGGRLVPATSSLKLGSAAMWGILRGAGERIKECELYGQPYFYIDHGYFSRGHYDGHYRVVFCDRQLKPQPQPSDGERWEALGLEVRPPQWIEPDAAILYLPISRHVADFKGIDAKAFDVQQLGLLKERFPETPVVIKDKYDGDLVDFLEGASLVVGYESNALLEASLAGYAIEELGFGPAAYLSQDRRPLQQGNISRVVRESTFKWLADNQWTLEEMRSGQCWLDLMDRYGHAVSDALAA